MMIEIIAAGLETVENVYGFMLDYMLYIAAGVAAVKYIKSNAKKESVAPAEEKMEGAEKAW